MSPARSATMPTTSWFASCTVNAALVVATVESPVDQVDLELPAERGRLGVQAIGLVGLGRQVDRGAEAGPALGAAGEPQLADDRRPRVGRAWTSIAIQDPVRAWPSEEDVGLHGHARRRRRPASPGARLTLANTTARQDRPAGCGPRGGAIDRRGSEREVERRTGLRLRQGMDRSKDAFAR